MNKKTLTEEDYQNYMNLLSRSIAETERRIKWLDKAKEILNLSFEDWVIEMNK